MKAWASLFLQRWQGMARRERFLMGMVSAVLVLALLWWLGFAPALSKLEKSRVQGPQLAVQLQSMREQAQEVAALKARRQLSADESLRLLESAVNTLGAGSTLNASNGRALVQLKATDGHALSQWLTQVRSTARLAPTELRLQLQATGSPTLLWEGTVVFSLPDR
jgi:general secretion pathway protein M